MRLSLALVRAAALAVALVLPTAAPVAAVEPGDFRALAPGEFAVRTQRIPVRVVFIGFRPGSVDTEQFLAGLPKAYEPLVRSPQYYGLDGRNLGLRYEFDYQLIQADAALEQGFFARLARLGRPGPLTTFQQQYNDQERNAQVVSDEVLYIDAASAQRHLQRADPSPAGVYTVYFINWHGHPDFRFHVYTREQERDPDTGANFGAERDSRRLIAWGGGAARSWFYDLSAGPEAWSYNWNVDDRTAYRIPPAWEYASGAYREPAELSADLARITRYVAINLLFTPSPLYDPLASAPGRSGAKVADLTQLRDTDGGPPAGFRGSLARARLSRLQPQYRWKLGARRIDPIGAALQRAFQIFVGNLPEDGCWLEFFTPAAELFCHLRDHRAQYVPAYRADDHVAAAFAFETSEERLGVLEGVLGLADDNYSDGTPSFNYVFSTAQTREEGFGLTQTAIHEWGHHLGLSHPHDGYDFEEDLEYAAEDPDFAFAWSGDESHTAMNYLNVVTEFSRFDQDNLWRWETAGYLNWANAVLGDLLAHPRRAQVRGLLAAAEREARQALANFERWNYLRSAHEARSAYLLVQLAAGRLGVEATSLRAALAPLPAGSVRRHRCKLGDHLR